MKESDLYRGRYGGKAIGTHANPSPPALLMGLPETCPATRSNIVRYTLTYVL